MKRYNKRLNLILAILHLILAIFVLSYIQNDNENEKYMDLSLIQDRIKPNLNNGKIEHYAETLTIISPLSLKIFMSLFFFITSGFHFFYWYYKSYNKLIEHKNNYFRWIEYSLSASIMTFLIGILSGVNSIDTLILLSMMTFSLMYYGDFFEDNYNKNNRRLMLVSLIIPFIMLITIFSIIIKSFYIRIYDVNELAKNLGDNKAKVPLFVYLIVWGLFGFYLVFGLVPVVQKVLGIKYEKVEKIYLMLSLFSKAFLGITVAMGIGERIKQ